MIPLYGFLKGDTIGLLLLAYPEDTVQDLARKLSQLAQVRVKPREGLKVYWEGKELPQQKTVKELGLSALDKIEVGE